MISLAEFVQSDIKYSKKIVDRHKEAVYSLEHTENLSKTQIRLKVYLIRNIFDTNRKIRSLERKLKYLLTGNGIQKEWSGE